MPTGHPQRAHRRQQQRQAHRVIGVPSVFLSPCADVKVIPDLHLRLCAALSVLQFEMHQALDAFLDGGLKVEAEIVAQIQIAIRVKTVSLHEIVTLV